MGPRAGLDRRTLPYNVQQLHVRQPSTILCKTRGCLCSFRLLMMGGVSPAVCEGSPAEIAGSNLTVGMDVCLL